MRPFLGCIYSTEKTAPVASKGMAIPKCSYKKTHCGAMEAFVPATLLNIQLSILCRNAAEITNPRPFQNTAFLNVLEVALLNIY